MTGVRQLAPQFLPVVGSYVVAVDRAQPVAVTLSPTGEVRDAVSWAGAVPPPSAAAWPNRRIAVDGDRVVVQDLPDVRPVSVAVRRDGALVVTPLREEPDASWQYPRLLGAVPRSAGPWEFRSYRDGYRLRAEVVRPTTWSLGRGSIVTHAVLEDVAVVAVRRADVRPWVFAPQHELLVIDGEPVAVAPIDISALCWPSPRADVIPLLSEYLPFTLGQASVLRKRGGRDVRIHVAGLDSHLVVELEFGLDGEPGRRFVRRDEPLDELGNVAGLAFLNIILDDESFDLLATGPTDDQGRILV